MAGDAPEFVDQSPLFMRVGVESLAAMTSALSVGERAYIYSFNILF